MQIEVATAAINANGEPDFFLSAHEVTNAQYQDGRHYDRAKDLATSAGYTEPFVCFDEIDAPWLLKAVQAYLSEANSEGGTG